MVSKTKLSRKRSIRTARREHFVTSMPGIPHHSLFPNEVFTTTTPEKGVELSLQIDRILTRIFSPIIRPLPFFFALLSRPFHHIRRTLCTFWRTFRLIFFVELEWI